MALGGFLAGFPQGLIQAQQFTQDQDYRQILAQLARQQMAQRQQAMQQQQLMSSAARTLFGAQAGGTGPITPGMMPDQGGQPQAQPPPPLPPPAPVSGAGGMPGMMGPPPGTPPGVAVNPLQADRSAWPFPTLPVRGAAPTQAERTSVAGVGPGAPAVSATDAPTYVSGARESLGLAPEQQSQARDAATDAAMMLPPQMAGRFTPQQIAQAVERASPGAPDDVKGAAMLELYKFLAPQGQQAFQQAFEMMKFGVGEQDRAETRAFRREQHADTEQDRAENRAFRQQQAEAGKGADWQLFQTPDGFVDINRKTQEIRPVAAPRGTTKIGAAGAGQTPEVDPQKDTMAKAISEYRLSPLSGWALRTPWGKQTMENVMALNPDYQATEYGARSSATRAFASGRQGDAVRFVNVAIDHLNVADQLGEALANNDQRMLNTLKNTVQTQLGYDAPLNFETAKLIVGDEVAKAVIGGVGAASDRIDLQKKLDAANSPEQLRGVSVTLKRLMAGQLGGLRRQFQTGTGQGAEKFEEKLSPAAQKELGGYMGGQPGGGGNLDVSPEEYEKLPSGSAYTVPGNPTVRYKQ